MSLIGGLFYFEVQGFQITRSALTQTITIHREGAACRLDFPQDASSFSFTDGIVRLGDFEDPREYTVKKQLVDHGGWNVEVRVLQIAVSCLSELNISDFDACDQSHSEAYSSLFERMRTIARQLVVEFTELVRLTTPQAWLEPEGLFPRQIGMTSLVDLDSGRSFDIMVGAGAQIHVLPADCSLDEARLHAIEQYLKAHKLAAEELILGQAIYLSDNEERNRPNQAVLLAAMAVELLTKRLLRETSQPQQVALVDLLLNNPRDWSMSAVGLFTKALLAVGLAAPEGFSRSFKPTRWPIIRVPQQDRSQRLRSAG